MKWTHLVKMVLPTIILTFSLCAHAQRGAPPLGSKATDPDAYYMAEIDTLAEINLDYVDSNNRLVREFADNWVPLGDFFHDGRAAIALNWHQTFGSGSNGQYPIDSSWSSIVRGYGKHGEKPDRKPFLDSIQGHIVGVADFDGNGYEDLVMLHYTPVDSITAYGTISVLYFDSGAKIIRIQRFSKEGPGMAWVGDFNGDGHPDLVLLAGLTRYMVLGTGSGLDTTMYKDIGASSDGMPVAQTFVADFNRDGCDDIVYLGGPTGPHSWFTYGSRDSGLGRALSRDLGKKNSVEHYQHTGIGYFLTDSIPDFVLSKYTEYTYEHYNDFYNRYDTLHKRCGLIYIVPGGPDFEDRQWLDDSGEISAQRSHAFVIPEPTLIEPDLNWTYNYWQDGIQGFGMFDSPDPDIVCSDLGPLSRDSHVHVLDIYCGNGDHFLYSCGPALDYYPDAYIEPLGNLGQAIGDWNQDGVPDFLLEGEYYDNQYTAVRYVASILPGGDYIPHTKRPMAGARVPAIVAGSAIVYPNPANGSQSTYLKVALESSANIVATIADATGRTIDRITSSSPMDEHIVPLDVAHLSPGCYFISIDASTGEHLQTRMMVE